MPYSLYNDKISNKGFKVNVDEVPVLQMRLGDAYNVPLIVRRPVEEDPGSFTFPAWSWKFYEEVAGGLTFEHTDVVVLDGDKAFIGATLLPNQFISDRNYRHQLSMKWPEESNWDVVAQGSIVTYSPLRGLATRSVL